MSDLQILNVEQRETWRTLPGFGGHYEVSDLGRVRSSLAHGGKQRLRQPKPKATFINKRTGYLMVTLQKSPGHSQAYHVHGLVALAFLGPRPDGKQVAHGDGDRGNARLENLRYATPIENAGDKVLHGTNLIGEKNPTRKLSEDEVRSIRARRKSGELQRDIAAAFGISQQLVSRVCLHGCWSHVSEVAS